MEPYRKTKPKFSVRTTIESNTPGAFTKVKSEVDEFQIAKPRGAERIILLNVDLHPEATPVRFQQYKGIVWRY